MITNHQTHITKPNQTKPNQTETEPNQTNQHLARMCVGKKKHLARRLIATRQSTPWTPLSDVG